MSRRTAKSKSKMPESSICLRGAPTGREVHDYVVTMIQELAALAGQIGRSDIEQKLHEAATTACRLS